MKKFLEDLRQELKNENVDDLTINDIIADHEEMINNAIEEGMAEADIEKKFGNPKKLAKELAEDLVNNSNEEGIPEAKMTLWKEFALQADTINIETRLTNDDIAYYGSDSNTIQVLWTKPRHLENYDLEYDGKTLRLSYRQTNLRFNLNIIRKGIKIKVLLPQEILIANFMHHGTNSDAEYQNMRIGTMNINTTNGDFTIENVEVGKAEWHSVNGDFKVAKSMFSSISATMVSGDIQVYDSKIEKEMEIGTVSGDVSVKNTKTKELDYHTVSGDFKGKEFYPEKISFRSVSGDIDIKNTDHRYIEIVSKKTVSGDINIG